MTRMPFWGCCCSCSPPRWSNPRGGMRWHGGRTRAAAHFLSTTPSSMPPRSPSTVSRSACSSSAPVGAAGTAATPPTTPLATTAPSGTQLRATRTQQGPTYKMQRMTHTATSRLTHRHDAWQGLYAALRRRIRRGGYRRYGVCAQVGQPDRDLAHLALRLAVRRYWPRGE